MLSLSSILDNYVTYNPNRVYDVGDYVIAYHSSYKTILLYQCIRSGATDKFDSKDWTIVNKAYSGLESPKYRKAPYLGACASNIVYAIRQNPDYYVPKLPPYPMPSDESFDNFSFF